VHDSRQVCRVCGGDTSFLGVGRVLDLDIQYAECPNCGYVQTEAPHWLERAYAEAINDSDTGIMARNTANARISIATLWALKLLDKPIVDWAGGYGILVRLLRDYGVDALWSDPYCDNLIAPGFVYETGPAGLVTAFEAFEHFVEPDKELDKMLEIAPNILFSTLLLPHPTPQPGNWWYYGQEHGQHIGFFTAETLQQLARKKGKHFVSDGSSYHLFSEKPVNAILWKLIVRLNKLIPPLAKIRLQSKTWSDHLRIVNRSAD